MKQIKVLSSFFVNDVDLPLSFRAKKARITNSKASDQVFDYISPNPKLVRRIEGYVDDCSDLLYDVLIKILIFTRFLLFLLNLYFRPIMSLIGHKLTF